ncbi:unnamed protein product [Citrullus colocynthis]|uniref:NB-ARC domain-containing protein n=1 Tax=Citrullus colocynthis TaxID=252529 RepID=A0ABP0Y1S0_9ROSI
MMRRKSWNWTPKPFSYMTELKILEISNVKLSEHRIEFLSNQLRVLKWLGFPLHRFPNNFQPPFMVQLILPGSRLEKLWEGKQNFEWLKEIDVSESKYLVATPDFSSAPNLERLVLRNCSRLSEIHPSISSLSGLGFLEMGGCVNVRRFSCDIICCSSPPQLTSNPDHDVDKFEEEDDDDDKILVTYPNLKSISHLTYLNLKNCTQLSTLPIAMGSLTSLLTLNLNGCKSLVKIPPSLWTLNSLVELDIGGTSVKHLLKPRPVVVWEKDSDMDHDHHLIPPVVFSMKNLTTLNFEKLCRSIWTSFTALLSSNYRPQCIRDLILSNCNLVDEDIPHDLRPINTLEILDLSGNHFVRLSESLSQLINLKALYLNHCNKLKQLPTRLPTSLRYVAGIKSFPVLPNYSEGSSTTISSPLLSNYPQQLTEEEYSSEADTANINKMEQPRSSNLVGMEDQLDKVYNLLDLERKNEVIFLGIFGMRGIGKTSLARVVYETIAHKFESSCFLHISKESNLPTLQHQLLSQLILSKGPIKVGDKNYGEELIKKYVTGRKVVIVLDGVDEEKQIEKLSGLARSPDWFSPGSRVIITGSNRKVLGLPTYEGKVVEYNVAFLDDASAFQLFSKHAFKHNHPPHHDFIHLSNKIIKKLDKLPLALTGIGSFLFNKDIDIWKETLTRISQVEEDFLSTISHRN